MDTDTMLLVTAQLRETFQKQRIAMNNRIAAIESGRDNTTSSTLRTLQAWYDRFETMEQNASDELVEVAKEIEIVNHMVEVKGISFVMAARLVAYIDIYKADTVSALWRYCGYAVDEAGRAERPVKGQKLSYNKRVKTTCFLIGLQMLKCNSPYRKVYDDSKAYYEEKHPEWTPMHRHLAAMRKMIKVFLAHVWIYWRTLEGLNTRPLYVHEKLGHSTVITPEEMGWKPLSIDTNRGTTTI